MLEQDVVVTSLVTAATVILLYSFGIGLAVFPKHPHGERGLLTQDGIRFCSMLVTRVMFPALSLLNVAQVKDLNRVWPVLFWHIGTIALNMLVAWTVAILLRLNRNVRAVFVAVCSFGSIASVPYVVLQTLCEQPELAVEDECFDRVAGFIAVGVIAWHLSFWSFGQQLLLPASDLALKPRLQKMLRGSLNVNVIAPCLGLIIASIPQLQQLFFTDDVDDDDSTARAPLSFLTSAVRTVANSSVGLVTLILSGTLGKRILLLKRFNTSDDDQSEQSHDTLDSGEGPTTNTPTDKRIARETDLDQLFDSTGTQMTRLESPAALATETRSIDNNDEDGVKDEPEYGRTFVTALVLTRVLLLGTIQFSLVYAFSDQVFPASDDSKLIRLMLFVQAVIPSSSIGVVACQGLGLQKVAELMAMAILFQQLLITVVMMLSNSLALSIVYS
eukprot:m.75115 g.75115  ORF g.75115 m.75115 type:complete len:444 (-) comp14396_c0_seq1:169-1500(-)